MSLVILGMQNFTSIFQASFHQIQRWKMQDVHKDAVKDGCILLNVWRKSQKTSYIPKNKWPSLQAFKSTPADLQTAETKSALQNLSDFMSKAYDKIKSEKKLHLTDTEILQEIILSPVVHILGDSMMRDVGKMIYQKSKYQNLNLWIESDLNS